MALTYFLGLWLIGHRVGLGRCHIQCEEISCYVTGDVLQNV